MSHRYDVLLDQTSGVNVPTINARFGRITVLLGANGSGKSSALNALSQKHGPLLKDRRIIRVEGGRTVKMPTQLELTSATFQKFGTLDRATKSYSNKVLNALSSRIEDALFVLLRQGEGIFTEHSKAVTKWQENPGAGDCPKAREVPIDKLFASFQEIFPEIALSLAPGQHLTCTKAQRSYSFSELSDGERQVLALLADISMLAPANSLLLIDEPELNLHPRLANRVWDRIESDLPDAVFVYCTHSVGFAMRPNVEQIIALSAPGQPAVTLSSVADLEPSAVREFLGSIPAIVSSASTLVTEGEDDDSFDHIFYSWLLSGSQTGTLSLGSCEDVVAATARRGVWEKLAAGVTVVGIIDRDFRSDVQLTKFATDKLSTLSLHEAESYLCDPELLCALAQKLGIVATIPTEAHLADQVVEYANRQLLVVVAQRTIARSKVHLAVSLDKGTIRRLTSIDELRAQFESAVKSEVQKVDRAISEDVVLRHLDEETSRCTEAITTRNISQILRFFPGKQLLNQLAALVGCRDAAHVARGARKHIAAQEYPAVKALQDQIRRMLSPPDDASA